LKYLESLGYTNKYQVLNAKDYNTPQNRERVFLFSFKEDTDYQFPEKRELLLKLADLLEEKVDDKYFISIERINNFNDMTNRNGFIRGLTFKPHEITSPFAYTITTRSGARSTDNFIIVPEKTIRGYKEAEVGDGIYINRPHQKRGVVQKSKIQTLKTTVNDIGVVVNRDDLISIRKITPREAWRLMGWEDERIDLVIREFSDAQLYKMAGNGIVINVLKAMFEKLKIDEVVK
jgi:DNA (cytosine-5)-methyltransferase 1